MGAPIIRTYNIFDLSTTSAAAQYGTWPISPVVDCLEDLGFVVTAGSQSAQITMDGLTLELAHTKGGQSYTFNQLAVIINNYNWFTLGGYGVANTNNAYEVRKIISYDFGGVAVLKFVGYIQTGDVTYNGMIVIDKTNHCMVLCHCGSAFTGLNPIVSAVELTKWANNVTNKISLMTTAASDNKTESNILIPYLSEALGISGNVFTFKPSVIDKSILYKDITIIDGVYYLGLGTQSTGKYSGYIYKLGEV